MEQGWSNVLLKSESDKFSKIHRIHIFFKKKRDIFFGLRGIKFVKIS